MSRSLRFGLAVVFFGAACSRDLSLPQPPPTTAFLTGRVVAAVPGSSASAPVAGARVTVLNSNLNATTNERGQFLLGPVPEGTYRLFFSSKSRQRIVSAVPVKPGATNSVGDVSLQENALLTGRALIQGRTSGNVGITVFSPGTDYVTTTADNGGWLLGNLPEGAIRATAWRPGFAPATTTDITLQGGVVTSAVDLILEPETASAPPGSITGRVIVIGRDDSAGVTVKAVSVQSREVKATATTTATGEFVLPNLSSDLYLVTLDLDEAPSRAWLDKLGFPFEARGPQVTLRIDRQRIADVLPEILRSAQVRDVSVEDVPLEEIVAELFRAGAERQAGEPAGAGR
jgi:hypothetical protein